MTSSARSSLMWTARRAEGQILVGGVLLVDAVAGFGLDAGLLGVVDAAGQVAMGAGCGGRREPTRQAGHGTPSHWGLVPHRTGSWARLEVSEPLSGMSNVRRNGTWCGGYHRPDDRPRAAQRRRVPGLPVRRLRGRAGRAGRPAGPPPSLLRRGRAGSSRTRPPGGVLPVERLSRLPGIPGLGPSRGGPCPAGQHVRGATGDARSGRAVMPDEDDVAADHEGDADGESENEDEDARPLEQTPRRNPPRDWAAPPPWASGPAGGAIRHEARSARRRAPGSPAPARPRARAWPGARPTAWPAARTAVLRRRGASPIGRTAPTIRRHRPTRNWPAWSARRRAAGLAGSADRTAPREFPPSPGRPTTGRQLDA